MPKVSSKYWKNKVTKLFLKNMIQQLQEQLEQAKLGLEQVTKLKDELLQKMEEYKHQNQLLAQYPDLNGPLRNTMEYASEFTSFLKSCASEYEQIHV